MDCDWYLLFKSCTSFGKRRAKYHEQLKVKTYVYSQLLSSIFHIAKLVHIVMSFQGIHRSRQAMK